MGYISDNFTVKFEPQDKLAFLSAIIVCAIAYSYIALQPVWVPDDLGWQVGLPETRSVHHHGRWALWLWGELTKWQPLSVLSWAIAIVCYSASGTLIAKLWEINDRNFSIILVILFAIYPGFVQEGKWDLLVAPFALAHFLTTLAIFYSYRSVSTAIVSGFFLMIAIAIYQSLISYAVVLVLFNAALLSARGNLIWETSYFKKIFLNPFVTGIVGVTLYALSLVLYRLSGRYLGRGIDKSDSSLNIIGRIMDGFTWVSKHITNGFDDFYGKYLLTFLILVAIAVWLKELIQKKQYVGLALSVFFVISAIAAIYLHQYASPKIQQGGWQTRAATGLSLIAPFLIALCWLSKQKAVRLFALTLGGLIAINWIAYTESYAYRWHLKSQQVAMEANRILIRIESSPGYDVTKPVIFPYGYDFAWYKYDAYRATNEFLQFFTNRRIMATKEQVAMAQKLAIDMSLWPARESIKVTDKMIIVAMNTPLAKALREKGPGKKGSFSSGDVYKLDKNKHGQW